MRASVLLVALAVAGCSHGPRMVGGDVAENFFVVRLTRRDAGGRGSLRGSVEVSSRVAERREPVGACFIERGSVAGWKAARWAGTVVLSGAGLPAQGLALGPEATVDNPARVDDVAPFAEGVVVARIDATDVGARRLEVRAPGELRLTKPVAPAPLPSQASDAGAGDASVADAGTPPDPATNDGGSVADAAVAVADAGTNGNGSSPSGAGAGPSIELDPTQDLEVTWTSTGSGRVQVVLGADTANGGYISGFCNVATTAGRASLPKALVRAVYDEGIADVSLEVFTVNEAASLRDDWQVSLLVGSHGGTVPMRTKTVTGGRIPATPGVREQSRAPAAR